MADFKLSANIEVRKQAPLDDRLAKMTKADLIKPESWASDNGTYYVYDYMLVGTSEGLFMLVDKTKLLSSDYSGWKRIGNDATPTGGLSENEVKDLIDQALGIALDGYVQKVDGKGLSTNDYTNEDKTKLDGLNNYDDTLIQQQINSLTDTLNTLVNDNATEAIDAFNEIVAFLANINDRQTLEGIINGINQAIAKVEGKIPTKTSQLENDSNFLTEHQSLEHLATKEELASKQDVIEDLEAIREGSQRAIPTKVSELENDKGYLTEHQDISHLVTRADIEGMAEDTAQAKANSEAALTQSNQAKVNADAALTTSNVAIESIKSLQGLSNADEAMVELAKQITQIAQNTSDIQALRDRHQPPMTEEQFQAIEEAGELKEGTFYYIYEE